MTRKIKIAVIGGGVSGATSAYSIALLLKGLRLPHAISIFEGSDRLGGKICSDYLFGAPIEYGAEGIVLRDRRVRDLVASLGLTPLPPAQLPFAIKQFGDSNQLSKLVPVAQQLLAPYPHNIGAIVRQAGVSWSGKIAAIKAQARHSHEAASSIQTGVKTADLYGSELASKVIDPIITGIYGQRPEKLDQKIIGEFLGRRFDAPKVATDHSARSPVLYSLKEGLDQLVTRQIAISGAQLHLRTSISKVIPTPGGVVMNGERFDHCVIALPLSEVIRLVGEQFGISESQAGSVQYSGRAVMTVVSSPLGDNKRWPPVTGYIIPGQKLIRGASFYSKKWPHASIRHRDVFRVFFGGDGVSELTEADGLKLALQEIESVVGRSVVPTMWRFNRWNRAVVEDNSTVAATLKQLSEVARGNPAISIVDGAMLGQGIARCILAAIECAQVVCDKMQRVMVGSSRTTQSNNETFLKAHGL